MSDTDIQWAMLICYARAAGAKDLEQAEAWAKIAVFEVTSESLGPYFAYIDGIAESR